MTHLKHLCKSQFAKTKMAKILAESLLMKFTAQYTFFTFNFYIALQEMKVIHDIHALWNKSIISLFLKDISRTNSTS